MDIQATMKSAMDAMKAGDKTAARDLLMKVVETDETNEQAWLWLAGAMDDPAETRICLENVLHLNPSNQRAQQGLTWLQQKHPQLFVEPAPAPTPTPAPPASPPPMAATGATIALEPPAAPMVAAPVAPSYHVPNADGSNIPQQQAADIQPCPRCGKPTRLADSRCRACGASLMISVYRTDANPRYAKVAGTMSLIYACFYAFLCVAGMVLVGIYWSGIKSLALRELAPAQRKTIPANMQRTLDQIYDRMIEPAFVVLAVVLLIAVVWIVVSINVRRLSKIAYIVNWLYVLPIGVLQALSVVEFSQSRDEIAALKQQLPPQANAFINGYVGGVVFATVYIGLMVVFMVMAWKNFTKQSIRFVANDPETSNAMHHFNHGVQYNRQGLTYQAMVEWERAVKLSPGDATFRHALGLCYASLKRPAEALQQLDAALQAAPHDTKILEDRNRIAQFAT